MGEYRKHLYRESTFITISKISSLLLRWEILNDDVIGNISQCALNLNLRYFCFSEVYLGGSTQAYEENKIKEGR